MLGRSVLLAAAFSMLCLTAVPASGQPGGRTPSHQDVMTYVAPDGGVNPVLSAAHWQIRRQQILEGMQAAMGPLPNPAAHPDPDSQIVETRSFGDVRRITLTVVVEPGDRLPMDLYLPASVADDVATQNPLTTGPQAALPAMLALHPTGAAGKRIVSGETDRPNRQYGLELAQRGYVTLCPDYPPFGDYQYDFASDDYVSGSMKGIFNHQRCVDLLCALPYVDADRVGVIGHSLGGHNAMFLGVFDERVKVIVSSCGWTPFHDYYGGNIAGWTSDRYMPRLRDVYGLDPDRVPFDFYEVVAALAPRTFVSVSPERDSNFDVAGVRKAVPEARKVFSLLDAADELILLTPDCEHDFPTDMRQQSYAVIDRVLNHTPTAEIAADYRSELPRIPAREPADALESFAVAEGFGIELTAAEPLVTDPVAMAFDADGRLYVVEMKGYSEQPDDNRGRVRLLTDENSDGRFDTSVVFADGLSWPTAVTCWDGGIFVGAAPDILYLKDTDGDDRADVQRVIFRGFGRGNVQGLLNSFRWGPDNRIYGATSSAAGTVHCVPHPDRPALTLRSRDFSYDPRTFDLRPESGGAQHGASFDDWGNRFVCSNSDHAQAIVYADRYLTRSPGLKAAPPRVSIAVDGGQAEVFRISPVEPWRIVRTRLRLSGMVRGPVEGGGRAAGYFTGSTGITVYRGDAWPESLKNTLIVGDVGSNIVHRKTLESAGVIWKARRMDDGFEFVASDDNWFRPVQFANAPDGCLHILDMYREVIEHPKSLPPEIKPHLDLTSGRDRGRLYRVVPTGFRGRAFEPLSGLTTADLVALLDHPNGWHRDTAQRLLFERGDRAAIPQLTEQLQEAISPTGWLHTLAVLDGLDALEPSHVAAAMGHPHPRVRERGVKLAEQFSDSESLADSVAVRAGDTDPRVRLQAALSLGEFPEPARQSALAQRLAADGDDPWMRTAVFLSLGDQAPAAWHRLLTAVPDASPAALRELTALVARQASESELPAMAETLAAIDASGTLREDLLRDIFAARPAAREHPAFARVVSTIIGDARRTLAEDEASVTRRMRAAEQLVLSSFSDDGDLLLQLLNPAEPPQVQQVAVATLSEFADTAIAEAVISRWPELSPHLRPSVQSLLLSRAAWTAHCLDAIAESRLPRNLMSPNDLQRLMSHPDESVASRARAIASAQPQSSRGEIIQEYQHALTLTGDLDRGKQAFRKHCSGCHRMDGIGHEVGPNLATIRNRGAETLLVNVLDPNREVNPAWRDYLVVTTAGTVHNGVIVSETATSLTLRRAEAKEESLLRSDIETIRDTGKSLMPEGLEKEITPQTLADIVSWILTAPGEPASN